MPSPTIDTIPPAPAADAGLSSALATGRALVLLQLLSRLLTFALNQGLVRLAPPSVFGTAAIQFDLVAATVLFLSREGIRNALLRRQDDRNRSTSFDPSLAAMPVRLGLAVAAGAVTLYLSTAPVSTTSQPYFHAALATYVLGALVELSIEPMYVRALRSDPPRLKVRVQAEGGMAIARAVVSFACLVVWPDAALLGFAVGYFAGSLWLARTYIAAFGGLSVVGELLWPKKDEEDKKDGTPTRQLAWANTRQSVVKHVLTEADRLAVGYISPLGDQGGYAVAINYGSLVARIVFQPLEETLLLLWSASSAAGALPLLTLALRLSSHLALLFPAFLPPLLPAVLPLLLPRRYTAETSAARTLATYLTAYLPVLSFNGISEAFVAATANPARVALQARVMFVSSGTFGAVLFGLTRSAVSASITTEQALIFASCTAMLVRIAFALWHARTVAREAGAQFPLGQLVPKVPVLLATAVAASPIWIAASRVDPDALMSKAALVGVGGVCGLAVLGVIFWCERAEFKRFKKTEKKSE